MKAYIIPVWCGSLRFVGVCVCVHACMCAKTPEEMDKCPETLVMGSYEPPDIDAKSQTHILCKSSKGS